MRTVVTFRRSWMKILGGEGVLAKEYNEAAFGLAVNPYTSAPSQYCSFRELVPEREIDIGHANSKSQQTHHVLAEVVGLKVSRSHLNIFSRTASDE